LTGLFDCCAGQCSILGVGRIFESPVPSGKTDIVIRKMMNMNLSVDHRVANGADARPVSGLC